MNNYGRQERHNKALGKYQISKRRDLTKDRIELKHNKKENQWKLRTKREEDNTNRGQERANKGQERTNRGHERKKERKNNRGQETIRLKKLGC